ncbi:Dps family protein [Yinghuangia soli]|uniref:DNA starvation/stationary phase protection protein n=1 Tax=Yinghuangia soli TaxID=2908204 RepID=A0AA41U538_9ACTN|nr:DNA starvation/stationary phase protection protein [Yinghuangia soli]MCF2533626.1 DNA starvation/stationary phase protection protein [Yinghuangia soli]
MTDSSSGKPAYTVAGLKADDAGRVAEALQARLHALNDLHLTLKHVHWNVVGPHFIAVHEMLDPQVAAVRAMADETAERIATLGCSPVGTPGRLAAERTWNDYSLGRADAMAHLGALDIVYDGVCADHRAAVNGVTESDPASQDMLIGQLRQLEQFQWFVRAHLEKSGGALSTAGADSLADAAHKAAKAARKSA